MGKKILIATDFSEPSGRAIEMAKSLGEGLEAEFTLVHAHFSPWDVEGEPPKHTLFGSKAKYEAFLMGLGAMLEKSAKEHFGDNSRVTTKVVHGRPEEAILRAGEELGADLICVGTSGKGAVDRILLGSVAQKLVRTSRIPVLSVR